MVTRETYLRQAARRFGRGNPERMDLEHWVEMVRSGESASAAALRHLGDDTSEAPEPGWCFDRFGMTRTRLPDGRVVCVAGEHEDHYDPDFCIYNDVVVIGPGEQVAIYGYAESVFPPTDFHTATLVDDRLILVGSLGYGGRRAYGSTQVYALELKRFSIAPVATHGDAPGWLSRHFTQVEEDGRTLRVSGGKVATPSAGGKEGYVGNGRVFRLDLRTGRWTAHGGHWLDPPLPEVPWPPGWAPIKSQQRSRDVSDGIARSVAPDHPLFVNDYVVVAEAALAALLRDRHDPTRYIVSQSPTWCGRDEAPLKFERYDSLDSWVRAAEGRGEWWSK